MRQETSTRLPAGARCAAFTLTQLIVAVVVIAIVAILAFPRMVCGPVDGRQVRAVSNARQIALALRMYAQDHDGKFPSFKIEHGVPGTTPVTDSNTAFAQLFPAYIQMESPFWQSKSKFCNARQPDNHYDASALDTPVETLKPGENEWAYVTGLTNSANSPLPLIASGFADPVTHRYSLNPYEKGGAWKGMLAAVVRVDGSAACEQVHAHDLTVHGRNGSQSGGDIFTTANAVNGWLQPENVVVNPK